MLKQKRYANALNKKKIEIDRQISANFKAFEHNMLVEEKIFKDYYSSLPNSLSEEISTFEKVELIDNWNLENGRKKR